MIVWLSRLVFVLLLISALAAPTANAVSAPQQTIQDRLGYSYDKPVAFTTPTVSRRTAKLVTNSSLKSVPWASTSSRSRSRAAKGTSGASRTVTTLTREQDTALGAVMRDSNRLEHIFGQGGKHNLGQLTQELGGQEAVVREAILRVPRSQPEGVFKLSSQIGPHPVTITGRMMNGVPRISNVWVPR